MYFIRFNVLILLFIGIVILCAVCLIPQAGQTAEGPESFFTFSEDVCSVEEICLFPENSNPVVHIEELHSNYIVQKKIVAILRQLGDKADAEKKQFIVAVEGTPWGPIDTSPLCWAGESEMERDICERLMRDGKIGAAEYLHALNQDFVFYGLEDKRLYDEGREYYLGCLGERDQTTALLRKVGTSLSAIREEIYHPDLIRLKEKTAFLYDTSLESIDPNSIIPPVQYMSSLAAQYGISFPHDRSIDAFAGIIARLESLSAEKVYAELVSFCDEHGEPLPDTDNSAAVCDFLSERRTDITSSSFLTLRAFSLCVEKLHSYDPERLLAVMRRCEKILSSALCYSDDQRRLVSYESLYRYLKKLFSLRLSYEELNRAPSNGTRIIPHMISFISDHDRSFYCSNDDIYRLQASYEKRQDFYHNARERDNVLCRNILFLRKKYPEALLVVISGGFHSQRIRKDLREMGISFVGVYPPLRQEETVDGRKQYHRALDGDMSSLGERLYKALRWSGVTCETLSLLGSDFAQVKTLHAAEGDRS